MFLELQSTAKAQERKEDFSTRKIVFISKIDFNSRNKDYANTCGIYQNNRNNEKKNVKGPIINTQYFFQLLSKIKKHKGKKISKC